MTENFGFGKRFTEKVAENAEEMAKIKEIHAKTKEALTKVVSQYNLKEYLTRAGDEFELDETLNGLSSRRFNILAGNILVDIEDITKIERSKGPNLFTSYVSKLHRIYTEGTNIESLPEYDTEQAEFYEYLSEFSTETVDTFDELDYGYTVAAFRSLVYLAFIVEYQNISEAIKSTKDSDYVIKDSGSNDTSIVSAFTSTIIDSISKSRTL